VEAVLVDDDKVIVVADTDDPERCEPDGDALKESPTDETPESEPSEEINQPDEMETRLLDVSPPMFGGGGLGGGWLPNEEFILYFEFIWKHQETTEPQFYLELNGDPAGAGLPLEIIGWTDTGWRIPCVIEWWYDDFDSSLPGEFEIFGYVSMAPDFDPDEFGTSFADSCNRVVSLTIIVGEVKPEPEPKPEPRQIPDDGKLHLLGIKEPMPGVIITDWSKIAEQPELWMAADGGEMRQVYDVFDYQGHGDMVKHIFNMNDNWMSLLIDVSPPSALTHGYVYEFEIRYGDGGISADRLLVDLTGDKPVYRLLGPPRTGTNRPGYGNEAREPGDDTPPEDDPGDDHNNPDPPDSYQPETLVYSAQYAAVSSVQSSLNDSPGNVSHSQSILLAYVAINETADFLQEDIIEIEPAYVPLGVMQPQNPETARIETPANTIIPTSTAPQPWQGAPRLMIISIIAAALGMTGYFVIRFSLRRSKSL